MNDHITINDFLEERDEKLWLVTEQFGYYSEDSFDRHHGVCKTKEAAIQVAEKLIEDRFKETEKGISKEVWTSLVEELEEKHNYEDYADLTSDAEAIHDLLETPYSLEDLQEAEDRYASSFENNEWIGIVIQAIKVL